MKPRVGAPIVRLSPCPEGWRAQTLADSCTAETLAALCEKLPAGHRAELWMPSSSIVTEWLTLPEAPREDLLSMAQLQLEKLLPYPAEEFIFDIELAPSDGTNVQMLAVTLSFSEIKTVAAPVRAAGMGPVAVGVLALQIARGLGYSGMSLAIWMEEGKPFMLVASEGRLRWVESLAGDALGPDAGELARALLGAELAGALSAPLTHVSVGIPGWADSVRETLPGLNIQTVQIEPSFELAGQWLPPDWVEEAAALGRKARLIERVQWAAIGYAALLALGFGWLAFEKSRIAKLDRQIAELQPQVEMSNARQGRWRNLEAAVEPSRFLVEILHQASKTVGAADIRITEFQMNPREFAFSAEASNVAEAIAYVGRLKKESELSAFKIDSPNPNILPNERAQFRVTGKLDKTVSKR